MPLPRRSSPPRLDRSAAGLALLIADGQLWLCGPDPSDPDTGPLPKPAPDPRPQREPARRRQPSSRPPGSRPGGPDRPPNRPDARPTAHRRPRPDLKLPRHWPIWIEELSGADKGKVRISSPAARGWAAVIRPSPDAFKQAAIEARYQVAEAGIAAFNGERTELDALTEPDDPTEPKRQRVADADEVAARHSKVISYARGAVSRPDVASPVDWTPLPDGQWMSPNGRTWQAKYCSRVIEKRRRLGLATSYEELHGARGATG